MKHHPSNHRPSRKRKTTRKHRRPSRISRSRISRPSTSRISRPSRPRSCCVASNKSKTCKRKDGKLFKLPRRFSKKTCLTKKVRGFTMKSSCAPFKYCKKRTNVKAKSRKNKKN